MSAVARRYAKALFALAREQNLEDTIGSELNQLAELVRSPELASAWNNPLLTAPERRQLTSVVREQLRLSDLFGRFLDYLAEHKRLRELPTIRDHYERLLDELHNRTRARIVSAAALTQAQLDRIVQLLQQRTGKTVIATVTEDPSLVGGFVVEVEGKVFDASVANQLHVLVARLGAGVSH
ncbi:MAG: ATP synthase F1 subunit delta [Candidatus Binatia bacterium]|nr:ATP synthase F1 subunit delta [Candidatus Binatia bacterium]